MAKGQMRSGREPKKPKAAKPKGKPATQTFAPPPAPGKPTPGKKAG